MERTETGYRLHCVCGSPDCNFTVEVEVYPAQNVVLLATKSDDERPFRLSELREALAEVAPAAADHATLAETKETP